MDIYEAINCRRSVRSFRPDPVPQESLERILEAARCAPSSLNLQPWKLVLVKDPQKIRDIIAHCPGQSFAEEAPLLVVGCALPTRGTICGNSPSNIADVAVAFAHLSLAAAAEGLGTCWVSAFDPEPIAKILETPETVKVVLISPLGYPTDTTLRSKHRKPMEELIAWDKYA